jgi:hypothetical protein
MDKKIKYNHCSYREFCVVGLMPCGPLTELYPRRKNVIAVIILSIEEYRQSRIWKYELTFCHETPKMQHP